MIKKNSLARDFKIFSFIILLSVFITSLCVGLIVHRSYHNKQVADIIEKAHILDRDLSEAFGVATHYTKFLSNKAIQEDKVDHVFLRDILSNQNYYDSENENLWTKFGWVNNEKKLLIYKDGIIEEKDFSMRPFIERAMTHPGKIFFSHPAIGILSNQWILPAGMGVSNINKKFLGIINTGFNLEKLRKKLENTFDRNNLVFMMLDENMKFILASSSLGLSYHSVLPPENLLQQVGTEIKRAHLENSFFKDDIKFHQFKFSFFKHSEKYPFYFIVGENLRVVNEEYWQIIFPRIAELTIMGVLFIVLLHYFRRHIVNPIMLLANAARKIENEKVNPKIYIAHYPEVKILADQLKDIQNTRLELIEAKKRADQANKNLEQKVKERTIELEKALAVKTEFLNNISHEVRTPVQGITTLSKGLVENWTKHKNEKKLELASAVAQNSQRLFSLVTNLLDFSIFNDDRVYFNFQENDLIRLIQDIIDECNNLYLIDKDIKLIFKRYPKNVVILIDYERIIQVLRNIITNAIKFTSSGTIEVEVKYDKNSKRYIISVKDQGIGIPEDELEFIFSPFTQSSFTKAKISGAGLGLAISKKIIDGHRGKIWAENNKDKGATIFVSLPEEKQDEIKIEAKKVRTGNILMIDDEDTCRMSMDILLSNTEFNLISASGGTEGLEYVKQHYNEIDLVLLDLMMPDMYGLNVLTEIMADPRTREVPVVIQSGTNDSKEIERSFKLGAKAYIRKPYQRQQILDIMHHLLAE